MSGVSATRNPALWTVLGVLGASSVTMSAAIGYFKIYLKKEPIQAPMGRQVIAIPYQSESFVRIGTDQRMPKDIEEVLGTQNYLSRHYVERKATKGTEPRVLQVHLAYYTGMIDTVPHVPDRCMVGAGLQLKGILGDLPIPLDQSRWTLDDHVPAYLMGRIFRVKTSYSMGPDNKPFVDANGVVQSFSDIPGTPFRLPRDPANIRLRTMEFADNSGNKRFAGYFFIANGGTVSRAEEVRLLAFDLKSSYSFYLKVEFQSDSVESGEELAAMAGKFLDENFAEIMRCTPDWVEVETGEYPPDNPMKGGAGPMNEVPEAGNPEAKAIDKAFKGK
ncbi:MAG: hypothetical protein NTV94_04010 [Planctomycetota bacterium]|nr:hypothetical protein [Planctomycetota bacterium]